MEVLRLITDELGVKFNASAPLMRDLEILGSEFQSICARQCNQKSKFDSSRLEQLEMNARLILCNIHKSLQLYINTNGKSSPFGIILPSGRSNITDGKDWRLVTSDFEI